MINKQKPLQSNLLHDLGLQGLTSIIRCYYKSELRVTVAYCTGGRRVCCGLAGRLSFIVIVYLFFVALFSVILCAVFYANLINS